MNDKPIKTLLNARAPKPGEGIPREVAEQKLDPAFLSEAWTQRRPSWCPHQSCRFRARSQDAICIGELPEPQDHGSAKGVNTHRLCQRGAPDDGEWLHTVEWNKGDAWNLLRCIKAAFGFSGA